MAKFVKLHDPMGREVYVNPEHAGRVLHVLSDNAPESAVTLIEVDGQVQMVREHVQEVVDMLRSA